MTQPVLIDNDHDLPTATVTPHRTLGAEAAAQEHQWDGTLADLNRPCRRCRDHTVPHRTLARARPRD